MPGLNVSGALPSIIGRSQNVSVIRELTPRFGKTPFQIRNTPSTSRPRPTAFTDLTRTSRLVNSNEIQDFALGNVKAIANRIVEFHKQIRFGRSLRIDAIITPPGQLCHNLPQQDESDQVTNLRFATAKF